MRSRLPKVSPQEAAIRASARGEDCTLRIPMVCNRDRTTTVYCHSNRLEHGKGMGLKAIAKALKRSEESTKDRAKQDGIAIAKLR